MLQTFKNGQGSVVLRCKLLDSSVSTGAGLTGLTSASSGLIISTIADNEATATAYTVAGSTIESITTLGTFAAPTATKVRFKEVDATNHKGVYELQIADARFAVSGAKSLLVSLLGATNLAQADFVVQLQSDDPYVAKPTNFASMSINGSGQLDVIKVAGTTQTARDLGASVLISSGTGTGQLSVSSGVIQADVAKWLGTAAATPSTAGVPKVDVSLYAGVAVVAGAIPAVAAGASGGLPTVDATNSVKVQARLKKNQALANFRFVMTDSTTDNPATGKTVTVTRGIDGSAHSAGTLSAVSEIGNGEYRCDFAAADLNGNVVSFRATASGCNDLIVDFFMEP